MHSESAELCDLGTYLVWTSHAAASLATPIDRCALRGMWYYIHELSRKSGYITWRRMCIMDMGVDVDVDMYMCMNLFNLNLNLNPSSACSHFGGVHSSCCIGVCTQPFIVLSTAFSLLYFLLHYGTEYAEREGVNLALYPPSCCMSWSGIECCVSSTTKLPMDTYLGTSCTMYNVRWYIGDLHWRVLGSWVLGFLGVGQFSIFFFFFSDSMWSCGPVGLWNPSCFIKSPSSAFRLSPSLSRETSLATSVNWSALLIFSDLSFVSSFSWLGCRACWA